MRFWIGPRPARTSEIDAHSSSPCCILPAPVAAPRERTMTMAVHKRGDRWHYAFCIRGVRYRGALREARNKVQAQKAETKIRQEFMTVDMVGRLGRHLSRSLYKMSINLGPEITSVLSRTTRSTRCL
jgi:hypothetical protein